MYWPITRKNMDRIPLRPGAWLTRSPVSRAFGKGEPSPRSPKRPAVATGPCGGALRGPFGGSSGFLRAAINHAHREGRITRPVAVHLPERPASRDRWLSRDEAAALLRAALREPRGQDVSASVRAPGSLYGTQEGSHPVAAVVPSGSRRQADRFQCPGGPPNQQAPCEDPNPFAAVAAPPTSAATGHGAGVCHQ